MSKKLLRKKLALMLATLKKKRPFYTELEYLESTGTQYIDTGYEMSAGKTMTFNGNIMWTQSNGNANFFYGYRSVNYASAVGDMRAFFIYGVSHQLAIRYGVNTDNSTSTISQNQKYNISFDGTNLKVDGTTFIYLSEAYTPAVYKSMWLFNCNCTGYYSSDVSTFSGRIYNWQIFEDGILVRDMIPVLGWDGKGYMYDKVSGQLFGNAGTGDFVVGRQIHPVEYLESTGTQWIDTGVKLNYNNGWEVQTRAFSRTAGTRACIASSFKDVQTNATWLEFSADNKARFGHHSVNIYSSSAYTTPQNIKFIYSNVTGSILVDDSSVGSGYIEPNGQDVNNLLLFADYRSGVFNGTRIYYLKIYDNGTLVRDYIPAIDSEGRGFMFDRVSHTCFLNAGTGTFKYPARELEYIKNNGSNTYLSLTGFYPTSDWDIECEVMGKTWGFIDSFNSLNIMGCGSSASTDSYTLTIAQGDVGATTPTCRRGGAGVRKVGCDLNVKYKIISTETSVTWNGEAGTFLSQPTGNTATTNPITLFRNPLSTAIGTMNIYSFVVKSHQTGNKILDLVPVLMNGSAGMLDKVNNVMYTNQGTGSWTLGKIVEPEYE